MSLKVDPLFPAQNSRRNRTGLSTHSASAKHLVAALVQRLDAMRSKRLSEAQLSECAKNMTCLVMDLLACSETTPDLWIGYSRRKPAYVKGGAYFDHGSGRSTLSYTYYLNCIDFLEIEGLVDHVTAPSGYGKYSSRMRPTLRLKEIFEEHKLSWASIKETGSTANIVIKNKDKKIVDWPDPGAFELEGAIRNLQRINENLSQAYLNLDISDADYWELQKRRVSAEDDEEGDNEDIPRKEPIDFSQRTLRRIFANGSFSEGGRFYGGWWQFVPSKLRKHILIDDAVTVELDFSTTQPRILYANVGETPPQDSYSVPGWDIVDRKVKKKLFSQLLNSNLSSRNPNQWHRFAPDTSLIEPPDGWPEMSEPQRNKFKRRKFVEHTRRDFSELIADMLAYHEPIADDFFSGVWGATQALDAKIAEQTMIRLLDQDVPETVLPIHDSFIVRRGAEKKLHDAMIASFNEVVQAAVKIDRDETVFDAPPDYKPEYVIADVQLHKETKEHLINHILYHRRYNEWVTEHGPL